MAFSRVVAIGDGSTTQFAVNFALDYLLETDVTCRVGNETDGSGQPLYRPITFLATNLIQVSGTPAGAGVTVTFERTVDKDVLRVDYNDGDELAEDNLMIAQKQVMMAVHEVLDGRFNTLTRDINAGGFSVTNLRDPINPQDAATKHYIDTAPTSVLVEVNALKSDTAAYKDAALAAQWAAEDARDAAILAASGAAGVTAVSSRAAMAGLNKLTQSQAILTEGGRSGLFVWRSGDATVNVAADPLQGLFVAATSDPTGATGAWTRLTFGAPLNIQWFGAVSGNTGNQAPAIQAAIDYLFAVGDLSTFGAVFVPRGEWAITTTVTLKKLVTLFGEPGNGSRIMPNGCDGITLSMVVGYGNTTIRDISIWGTNCTTKNAVYQPGTTNAADIMYGLTLSGVLVRDFSVALNLRTIQNVHVENCWFENVNGGVYLMGKCYVARFFNTKIIRAAGCGTATTIKGWTAAMYIDGFTYTTGGYIRPEGVLVSGCTIFGFSRGVSIEDIVYCGVRDSDLNASVETIRVGANVASYTSIEGNYIQVQTATAFAAVRLLAKSSADDSKVVIRGNRIETDNGAAGTTIGVVIALSGTGNCDNVVVRDNTFNNNTLYDIAVFGSGGGEIVGNYCRSTTATSAIYLEAIPSTRAPVVVENNNCRMPITRSASDVNNGSVILGVNTENNVRKIPMSSLPAPLTGAGAPAVNGLFIGQEYFDSTNGKWYRSNAAGSSAWVPLN